MTPEYMRLLRRSQELTDELQQVRTAMAYHAGDEDYRIALRPDVEGGDIFDHATLMDDIVVVKPTMFRAEQMDTHNWFVCCYLDDDTHDRIAWSVTARTRPNRIEWMTTELPETPTVYEGLGLR